MSKYLSGFHRFTQMAFRRMKKGAEEYGDLSFRASVPVLIQEIREEILDFVNWGYILYYRLEELERAYEQSKLGQWEQEQLEDGGEEGVRDPD